MWAEALLVGAPLLGRWDATCWRRCWREGGLEFELRAGLGQADVQFVDVDVAEAIR